MLTRLSVFQRVLWANRNEFRKTTKTRCWFKSKTQINSIGNLVRSGITQMFLTIEEAEETVLDFSKGTVKVYHDFILF